MNIEQIIEDIKQSACSECKYHKAISVLASLVVEYPTVSQEKPVTANRPTASPKTALAASGKKKCNKCGQIKSLAEFSKKANSKDGHEVMCKSCKGAYQKQWREKKMQGEQAQPASGANIDEPIESNELEYPGLQCKLCKAICSSKERLASHMRIVHGKA